MVKVKDKDKSGLLFLAGFFICLGTGMFFGRPAVGALMGLGIGFAAAYFAKKK